MAERADRSIEDGLEAGIEARTRRLTAEMLEDVQRAIAGKPDADPNNVGLTWCVRKLAELEAASEMSLTLLQAMMEAQGPAPHATVPHMVRGRRRRR